MNTEASSTVFQESIDSFVDQPHQWQGAEAKVYISEYAGQKAVFKQRFVKRYRHPDLDTKLNRARHSHEVKALQKAALHGIFVPEILYNNRNKYLIVMKWISGSTMRDALINQEVEIQQAAEFIGDAVARLHNINMVHGDLTTSNMILTKDNQTDALSIALIDFGLAATTLSVEDRAVDLYVLERAITSTHSQIANQLFDSIMTVYSLKADKAKETMSRLADVQLRGRKRDMSG